MRKNYILVADDSKPILHATTLWLNKHCPDNPVLTAENHMVRLHPKRHRHLRPCLRR